MPQLFCMAVVLLSAQVIVVMPSRNGSLRVRLLACALCQSIHLRQSLMRMLSHCMDLSTIHLHSN